MNMLKSMLAILIVGLVFEYWPIATQHLFPDHKNVLITHPLNSEYSVTYYSGNKKVFRIGRDSLTHVLRGFYETKDSSEVVALEIYGVSRFDSLSDGLSEWKRGGEWILVWPDTAE